MLPIGVADVAFVCAWLTVGTTNIADVNAATTIKNIFIVTLLKGGAARGLRQGALRSDPCLAPHALDRPERRERRLVLDQRRCRLVAPTNGRPQGGQPTNGGQRAFRFAAAP